MQPYIPIHLTQLVKGKLGAVAKAISFISNRQTKDLTKYCNNFVDALSELETQHKISRTTS